MPLIIDGAIKNPVLTHDMLHLDMLHLDMLHLDMLLLDRQMCEKEAVETLWTFSIKRESSHQQVQGLGNPPPLWFLGTSTMEAR